MNVDQGSSVGEGLPVDINAPQTYEQQLARATGRLERLTAKLERQQENDAPAEAIAATEDAIKQWDKKARSLTILLED